MIPASGFGGQFYAPLRLLKPRRPATAIMTALGKVDYLDDWHRRSLLILSRLTCDDMPNLRERVAWHIAGRERLTRRRTALVLELSEVQP